MSDFTCENCQRFRQHYVKAQKGYAVSGFGHCVYPRIKPRKINTPACENFLPTEPIHTFPDAGQASGAE